MEPIRIKLKGKLNPTQQKFHDSKARNRLFTGGRGSGKTTVGCIEALLSSCEAGARGGIFAPTYSMLKDATIPEVFRIFPSEIIKDYKRADLELILVNGSSILFRSLENYTKLANLILAWEWIDEGSLACFDAWQLLKGRTRQPGHTHRRWITSTPQGRNWLYEEFAEKPRDNYEWFQASTHQNAENLPEGYIEDLEDSYSGLFARQELMGEFVAFEGLIYEFYREHNVENPPEDQEWKGTVGGIDWGYSKPMAVTVARQTGDEILWQVDEFYEKRWLVDDRFVEHIKAFEHLYGKATWWCDPSEPQYINILRSSGLDARAAPNKVDPGINAVGIKLKVRGDGRPRYKVAENCINTIAEFETYHKDDKDKIVKEKDHAMDAVRYMIYGPESMGRATSRKAR